MSGTQQVTPEELFNTHKHLIESTLYRLLGQPYNVAQSKSMEYDDLLQYASEGLWKACVTYNSELSNFQTHAINHIRWAIKDGTNRESSLIKYDINNEPEDEDKYSFVGYDELVNTSSEDEDSSITYSEIAPSEHCVESEVYNKFLAREIINQLTDREREVIELRAEGKLGIEIAEICGISPQAVNYAIQKVKEKAEEIRKEVST